MGRKRKRRGEPKKNAGMHFFNLVFFFPFAASPLSLSQLLFVRRRLTSNRRVVKRQAEPLTFDVEAVHGEELLAQLDVRLHL